MTRRLHDLDLIDPLAGIKAPVNATAIPDWLFTCEHVPFASKVVWARLARYWKPEKGYAWPKQPRLAADLGMSLRRLNAYLQPLADEGLIEVERRGMGQGNHYRFLKHACIPDTSEVTQQDAPDPASTETPEVARPSSSEEISEKTISEVSQKHSALERADSLSDTQFLALVSSIVELVHEQAGRTFRIPEILDFEAEFIRDAVERGASCEDFADAIRRYKNARRPGGVNPLAHFSAILSDSFSARTGNTWGLYPERVPA